MSQQFAIVRVQVLHESQQWTPAGPVSLPPGYTARGLTIDTARAVAQAHNAEPGQTWAVVVKYGKRSPRHFGVYLVNLEIGTRPRSGDPLTIPAQCIVEEHSELLAAEVRCRQLNDAVRTLAPQPRQWHLVACGPAADISRENWACEPDAVQVDRLVAVGAL